MPDFGGMTFKHILSGLNDGTMGERKSGLKVKTNGSEKL